MTGPLSGVRVVEVAAIGPTPFAGMLLSDMGADVVRIDRPGTKPYLTPIDRGRRSIAVDLKDPTGSQLALDLIARADIVLEGFRPGVMERLGLGPNECLTRNPALVYGRMTGFGQSGDLSMLAGHDINYVALSGTLELLGTADGPPLPPLNLLGDFGGGGMLLALGVTSALHHARMTGQGQVVDAAMTDGVSLLAAMYFGLQSTGALGPRGSNGLDGGAPYYRAYETADAKWMAVGAIEPHFYDELLRGLELDPAELPDRNDRSRWPALHEIFERAFRRRSRDEWSSVFAVVDACVTPVLSLPEVDTHLHHVQRNAYEDVDGVTQPAPAPRFDVTPARIQGPPPQPGQHTDQILADWGVSAEGVPVHSHSLTEN